MAIPPRPHMDPLKAQGARRLALRGRFFEHGLGLFAVLDEALRFLDLNPAWVTSTGWPLDALMGRSIIELAHPEDLSTIEQRVGGLREAPSVELEFRLRGAGGAHVWLRWSMRRADGLFYADARDVTEQRRIQRALEESEARHRAILESAVDALITIDAAGRIQSINPATEALFGYRADELIGQSVSILMPSPHREQHGAYLSRYLETGRARVIGEGREAMARRKDGGLFPIYLAVNEIKLEGQVLFSGIIRDISPQREIERRLKETLGWVKKSQDDLVTILETFQAGTMILDHRGRVTFVNQTLVSLLELEFGEERPRFLEKNWFDLIKLKSNEHQKFKSLIEREDEQAERTVFYIELPSGYTRIIDIDVRIDPRDGRSRIVFFYDVSELQQLRERLSPTGYGQMIGGSAVMREIYERITQIAQGDWTVLIQGETGVGKELIARALHASSARRRGPFIAVNCAGLTETLLESQLFGHRRGSFTGATADQRGLFEAAEGGSIFLDEIGEISMKTQSALLRVLQEREIMRVGETHVREVNARIITATNRDLSAEVSAGRFRADLFYRIHVARVSVPPLRERGEDISLLALAFLKERRIAMGRPNLRFTPAALQRLEAYHWPGNVRELKALVERAIIHSRGETIDVSNLPRELALAPPPARLVEAPSHAPSSPPEPQPSLLRQRPSGPLLEREVILAALEWAEGNRARAARRLNVSRTTLYRRLKEFGIANKRGRQGARR